jgi:uncharacterized protein YggU (UPF0235/DUF167 family)
MARLHVRVQPGARRTGFVGWYGDIPKLAVRARPVDGEANEAVVGALAATLGLRRRQVRLVGGAASRTKRFEIEGVTEDELRRRLCDANPRATEVRR